MKAPEPMKAIRVVSDFVVEGFYRSGEVRVLDVRDLPLGGHYEKIGKSIEVFQTASIVDGYPTWKFGDIELSIDTDLFYDLSKPVSDAEIPHISQDDLQAGFSYWSEEIKEIYGLQVVVVTVIADPRGYAPNLLNQSVLASFVHDDRPCEVWHAGHRFYSNLHKWKKVAIFHTSQATTVHTSLVVADLAFDDLVGFDADFKTSKQLKECFQDQRTKSIMIMLYEAPDGSCWRMMGKSTKVWNDQDIKQIAIGMGAAKGVVIAFPGSEALRKIVPMKRSDREFLKALLHHPNLKD